MATLPSHLPPGWHSCEPWQLECSHLYYKFLNFSLYYMVFCHLKNPFWLGRGCLSLGKPIPRNNKGLHWDHVFDMLTNRIQSQTSSI